MSGADFKTNPPGAEIKIAGMPSFYFWSRDLIGATQDDVDAHEKGQLPPERHEQLAIAGIAARDRLADMPVPGVQDWMFAVSSMRVCN